MIVISTNWERNYTVAIGNGNDITRWDYSCYTNGSKLRGQSGAGAVIVKDQNDILNTMSFSLGKCTVFQVEMMAVNSATETLLHNSKAGNSGQRPRP